MIKQKQAQRQAIIEKLAKKIHVSKKRANEEFDFLKLSLQTPEQINNFSKELKLEEKEVEWLKL
jgi:hypothetical protein